MQVCLDVLVSCSFDPQHHDASWQSRNIVLYLVTNYYHAEMGADYPLAGASFNYVLGVWGEFPAWYGWSQ